MTYRQTGNVLEKFLASDHHKLMLYDMQELEKLQFSAFGKLFLNGCRMQTTCYPANNIHVIGMGYIATANDLKAAITASSSDLHQSIDDGENYIEDHALSCFYTSLNCCD